ncbi:MAG: hypothetical protein FWC51_04350 [Proteobacteria bacterium]|nr:hypothetical protein [Pseudomonadota bacterium]
MKDKQEILDTVFRLIELHRAGALGGEKMPEDENPDLARGSAENLLYFTLPMALNYQRDSYKLWAAANKTWADATTRAVFDPAAVARMLDDELRSALIKYGVALQPNKHVEIWRTISMTFARTNISDFFQNLDFDVAKIKTYILAHKKDFPYLSGPKILNYWLYVMTHYTDLKLRGRDHITVAPDTHVIQASVRLGLIDPSIATAADARDRVAAIWAELLDGTGVLPIDVHTPLWLWSRGGFKKGA